MVKEALITAEVTAETSLYFLSFLRSKFEVKITYSFLQLYRIGPLNLFAMRRTRLRSYYCFLLVLAV